MAIGKSALVEDSDDDVQSTTNNEPDNDDIAVIGVDFSDRIKI